MNQVTEQEAIEIYDSGIWKLWSDEEIVSFQLFQDRLCLSFDRFHEAVEKVFGRSVWTHEFAFRDALVAEYNKERPSPTFEEIVNLIPANKIIIVGESQ